MAYGKFSVLTQWALKKLDNGLVTPLNPEELEIRSQDLEDHHYDSGTFYIMTPDNVNQSIGINSVPYILPHERCIDTDEPSDLIMAEILYRVINNE